MALIRTARTHLGSRQTISRLIFEKIAELGEAAIGSFFPATYAEARMWRRFLGLADGYRFKRETFSTALARLRARGLIERRGTNRHSMWRLTARGTKAISYRGRSTIARPDGIGRIVIFDIPEKERKKRSALRGELIAAGFTFLQKSVWYGERPLPRDFLELIDALSLRSRVHIFSIRERGTIP